MAPWKRMRLKKCLTVIWVFGTCTVICVVHAIINPRHKFSSQTLINTAMRDHVIASRIATLGWQYLLSQIAIKKRNTKIPINTCILKHIGCLTEIHDF